MVKHSAGSAVRGVLFKTMTVFVFTALKLDTMVLFDIEHAMLYISSVFYSEQPVLCKSVSVL